MCVRVCEGCVCEGGVCERGVCEGGVCEGCLHLPLYRNHTGHDTSRSHLQYRVRSVCVCVCVCVCVRGVRVCESRCVREVCVSTERVCVTPDRETGEREGEFDWLTD